ncbi:MAG: pyruvate formate lyase family protein, partial [Armatimonadota bacterium]
MTQSLVTAVAWPDLARLPDTQRVKDLRRRVRAAMEQPPVAWDCPARIDDAHMHEPLPVRKARAIALKLSQMPTDLWEGQLFAGSMTLESPRVHAEWGFPDYTTHGEREAATRRGMSIRSVFGHVVPDYPKLLRKGLSGIRADAEAERSRAQDAAEEAFLDSVVIALDAVSQYAARLARRCQAEAESAPDQRRAAELRQMADNLRQVPAGPALTFWQALQSVWLLHMIFHSTMNSNAMGRLDQYVWPYLERDLEAGRLTINEAAELVTCF